MAFWHGKRERRSRKAFKNNYSHRRGNESAEQTAQRSRHWRKAWKRSVGFKW